MYQILQTKSIYHPASLAVQGDLGWVEYLRRNDTALQYYRWLIEGRSMVHGRKHTATAGAMLGAGRVLLLQGHHENAFDLLHEAFIIRKTLVGFEHKFTQNVLPVLEDALCLVRSKRSSTSKGAVMLSELRRRDFKRINKELGPDQNETKTTLIQLAKVYACTGWISSAKYLLDRITLQDVSPSDEADYNRTIAIIADELLTSIDIANPSQSPSLSIDKGDFFKKYDFLGKYFFDRNQLAQALGTYFHVIYFKHTIDSAYPAKSAELDFLISFTHYVSWKELEALGNISKYAPILLRIRTANDWFKYILLLMDGHLQEKEGAIEQAYHQHERAYRWAAFHGSDSSLYHHKKNYYLHYKAFNCYSLGYHLFNRGRYGEAIEMMVESLQSKDNAVEADAVVNLSYKILFADRYAILEILYAMSSSPKDELALFGREIGGLDTHIETKSRTGYPISDFSWLRFFYDAHEHYYEFGLQEIWSSAIVVLECLRIDRSTKCLPRKSIFDIFICTTL
jgi:tetratricopeptide (TPR) repeat protein